MAAPRILVLCESANPRWFSEPLVGWSHAEALVRRGNAHLVTQVRNREAILEEGWTEGVEFTAIDSEAVARPIGRIDHWLRESLRVGWSFHLGLFLPYYYYYERTIWKHFGSRIEAGEFDVVHRITPISPTFPSPMAKWCHDAGVPFVLGPLNGGVAWPPEFQSVRREERETLTYLRSLSKMVPYYRSTRECAAAIIVGSGATFEQMPEKYRDRCVYVPENAIDPERFSRPVEGPVGTPLRVSFVGRLVPYKGADMLVEAAAPLARAGLVTVDIIGDGPQKERLHGMVEELGVTEQISLPGWIEHTKLQDRLRQSDVFAFPSIREFGGGVVLEAMSLGIVPVVADYAGPSELVTDDTGYRVPMGDRETLIARFRDRLEALAKDPSGIREMGERARARAFDLFSWDAKAEQSHRIYEWALGRAEKPDFGMPLTHM